MRRLASRSGSQSWLPELKRLFIADEVLGLDSRLDTLVSCLRARGTRLMVYVKWECFLQADLVCLGCDVEGSVVLLTVAHSDD